MNKLKLIERHDMEGGFEKRTDVKNMGVRSDGSDERSTHPHKHEVMSKKIKEQNK